MKITGEKDFAAWGGGGDCGFVAEPCSPVAIEKPGIRDTTWRDKYYKHICLVYLIFILIYD